MTDLGRSTLRFSSSTSKRAKLLSIVVLHAGNDKTNLRTEHAVLPSKGLVEKFPCGGTSAREFFSTKRKRSSRGICFGYWIEWTHCRRKNSAVNSTGTVPRQFLSMIGDRNYRCKSVVSKKKRDNTWLCICHRRFLQHSFQRRRILNMTPACHVRRLVFTVRVYSITCARTLNMKEEPLQQMEKSLKEKERRA